MLELVLVLAPMAMLCIFVLDYITAPCRIRPGTAVRWGPFQHGVVMQSAGLDGYATMPPAAISKHRVSDHAALLKRRIPPPPLSLGSRILGVLQTVAIGLGAVGATCGLAMGVAMASGQYDAVLTLFNNSGPTSPVSFATTNTTALLESLYASVNLTLLRGRDGDPGEVILFNGTVIHGVDGKDCVLPTLFNGTNGADGRDGDNCTVTPALLALNATVALHTQQIVELQASDVSHDAFLLGLTTLVLETNASLVHTQDTQFQLLYGEVGVLHTRVDAMNATLLLNALVGTDVSHDAADVALNTRIDLLNETSRSWQGQTNLALVALSDRVTAEAVYLNVRISDLNTSRLAWEFQTQGALDVMASTDLAHTDALDTMSARVTTVNDTFGASLLALADATQVSLLALGDADSALGVRITVVNDTLQTLQATVWVTPSLTGGGSWTGGPTIDALTVSGVLVAPMATMGTVDVTGYLRATHIHSLTGTLNIGDSDNTTVLYLATGSRVSDIHIGTGIGPTNVYLGGQADTIYITGNLVVVTATYQTESNLAVTDKRVYLNLGGLAGSSGQAGLYVVDGAFNTTVYARQALGLNAWEFKSRDGPLVVLDQNLQTTADVVFRSLTVSFPSTLATVTATSITLSLTLGVTGATTLGSTLNVAALTTLASLAVSGASTLSGTLGVTGLATLGTLSVPGATTFGSTVGISGLLSGASATLSGSLGVGTTLGVTQGATFLSTVSIAALLSGAAATFTTLGASGAVTLSTTLGVTGACTFGSTVTVTGLWAGTSATLSTTFDVTGAATFGSTVGVSGAFTGTSGSFSTTLAVTTSVTSPSFQTTGVTLNIGTTAAPASVNIATGTGVLATTIATSATAVSIATGAALTSITVGSSGDTTSVPGAATFGLTVGITGLLSGTTASFSNTAATSVQTQGGLKFTGAAGTGVQFQNGGGSVLSYYEELSPDFGTTFTGALAATSATITFRITRIGRVVHLSMVNGFTGTCNSANGINSALGTALPARFIPTVSVAVGCAVLNAGVESLGLCEINGAGAIHIFNGGSQKPFSNTGSCGLKQLTASWPV